MQATKDCLTREYSFEDGNGGSRDQYLADNNINTFIITGFSDQEIENNNQQEKTLEMEADVKTDSPVLTVENLPKVCTNETRKYHRSPLKCTFYFVPTLSPECSTQGPRFCSLLCLLKTAPGHF